MSSNNIPTELRNLIDAEQTDSIVHACLSGINVNPQR
jgi:hypothetical protein